MNVLFFNAFAMLCGLGSAIFVTFAPGNRNAAAATGLAFAISAAAVRPERMPDPVWAGGAAALVAILQLLRPGLAVITAACGGALAGMLCSVLQIHGVPLPASLMVAGAVPAISAYLTARRAAFAPDQIREESLLLIVALGLAVAMLPGISEGWRSALALNIEEADSRNRIVSAWVLYLSGASMVLGGVYSIWRRR